MSHTENSSSHSVPQLRHTMIASGGCRVRDGVRGGEHDGCVGRPTVPKACWYTRAGYTDTHKGSGELARKLCGNIDSENARPRALAAAGMRHQSRFRSHAAGQPEPFCRAGKHAQRWTRRSWVGRAGGAPAGLVGRLENQTRATGDSSRVAADSRAPTRRTALGPRTHLSPTPEPIMASVKKAMTVRKAVKKAKLTLRQRLEPLTKQELLELLVPKLHEVAQVTRTRLKIRAVPQSPPPLPPHHTPPLPKLEKKNARLEKEMYVEVKLKPVDKNGQPIVFGWDRHRQTCEILGVTKGGQADRAGIQPGWVIASLNGVDITEMDTDGDGTFGGSGVRLQFEPPAPHESPSARCDSKFYSHTCPESLSLSLPQGTVDDAEFAKAMTKARNDCL